MKRNRGRILFVDDEQVLINVVPRMLNAEGFEVEYAQSGADAIEKYRKSLSDGHRFDIVIMDLYIPGEFNGHEAMKIILDLDPQAVGIASSGYIVESMRATLRDYGFKSMIAKPYTADELRRMLNEFFEPAEQKK